MNNISKVITILVIVLTSFIASADQNPRVEKKKLQEIAIDEVASKLTQLVPNVGGYSIVSCSGETALTNVNLNISAKLKEAIELPILTVMGQQQVVKSGSKNLKLKLDISANNDLPNYESLDDIDLDNMTFDCQKQENVEFKAKLTFAGKDNNMAEISLNHPKIGQQMVKIKSFEGKAKKNGFNYNLAVFGRGLIKTIDRSTGAETEQETYLVFKFRYNNSDKDNPALIMEVVHVADELKQAMDLAEITHETGSVEVTASLLNLRAGPGVIYKKLNQAKQGDQLYKIGRSGDWLNVKLDLDSDKSYWLHSAYVESID